MPEHQSSLLSSSAWTGFRTLLGKEVMRFWKVGVQTVGAPVLSALLYLLIFAQVLDQRVTVYDAVSYSQFLAPGLIMMSVLQNAFANSSSSLIQSKITGNIIFILLSPISWQAMFAAYTLAAIARALLVGLGVLAIAIPITHVGIAAPLWVLVFAVLGSALLGALGIIAGICSDKFDQLALFQNFLIMPLTMLSGVFYSLHSLPPFWQQVSHFNPFFYMIDGLRYGFFGQSDVSPWLSLGVTAACLVLVTAIALRMLASGYKLRT